MAVLRSELENKFVEDAGAIGRVAALMSKAAYAVSLESSGGNLAARKAYAKLVLKSPRGKASEALPYLLHTDNYEGRDITVIPLGSGWGIEIDNTDAEAYGQIFAVWDALTTQFG